MTWMYGWVEWLAEAGLLPEIYSYPFMARAVLVGLVLAPLLGTIGPLVVRRRLAFFSSCLGHSALTGVAVAILLGASLESANLGILGVALVTSLLFTFVLQRTTLPSDTVVGVFLSIVLGVGIGLLVLVTRRFDVHAVEGILFGSLVAVTDADLRDLLVISVFAALLLLPLYNSLLIRSFDSSLARARGIRTRLLDYLFHGTLALVVVASLQIAGAFLVEALIVIPAAAAGQVARSMRTDWIWSVSFALVSVQGGLLLSGLLAVPPGAAVVLVLGVLFAGSLVVGRLRGGA